MISHKEAIELLKKYKINEGILKHSIGVNKFGMIIAKNLIKKGMKVDLELVDLASLLHDIGKVISRETNEEHALVGEKILIKENLSKIATIVRRHRLDSVLSDAPSTIEEKIVYYSDKRVGQDLISLDERFEDWEKRYPDVQELKDKVFPKIKEIEKDLMIT